MAQLRPPPLGKSAAGVRRFQTFPTLAPAPGCSTRSGRPDSYMKRDPELMHSILPRGRLRGATAIFSVLDRAWPSRTSLIKITAAARINLYSSYDFFALFPIRSGTGSKVDDCGFFSDFTCFGFLASRLDLFCPFDIISSSD